MTPPIVVDQKLIAAGQMPVGRLSFRVGLPDGCLESAPMSARDSNDYFIDKYEVSNRSTKISLTPAAT